MRIRTVKYILKEGAINAYRNKLMSLASVSIVVATLVIFGVLLLVALNLRINLDTLKNQPQLEAYCYTELDDVQIKQIENTIKENNKVASYQIVTKDQALQKMKDKLANDATILDGYDASIFPVSFIIKLKDSAYATEVVKSLETTSGIEKVSYSQRLIDVISKVSYWTQLICGFMIIIFLIVSVFIISNTIKLTVFARRREISIMKYIGATDWFIRWPFVVEGVIIGVIGVIIAFVISSLGYNELESKFSKDMLNVSMEFFKLINIREVWLQIVAFYSAIGISVGAFGSFLSIRRYLRV
jgi:cell division transport system permease protein